LHQDEIVKTLEIVEVDVEEPFAQVFYRASVGTVLCRETRFFQLVDGLWLYASVPYFSEHSPLESRRRNAMG